MSNKSVFLTIVLISMMLVLPVMQLVSAIPPAPVTLDPKSIPKYVNQLTGAPPVYVPEYSNSTHEFYTVDVTEFDQQILPLPFLKTTVWGYGGLTAAGYVRNAPGPTFEATQGKEIWVRYQNELTGVSHLFAVDPTLHWANPNMIPMPGMPDAPVQPYPIYPPGFDGTVENPAGFFYDAQSPIPVIPHLHGGEVQSTSDGHPEAWFTPGSGEDPQGPAYNTELTNWVDSGTGLFDVPVQTNEAVFRYPNEQPPTTLWYHDHALGITRINVMSGLAGFYMLRSSADTTDRAGYIPLTHYEMPIAVSYTHLTLPTTPYV